MNESHGKQVLAMLLVLGVGAGIYLAHSMPGTFGNVAYLGALIFAELLILAVWKYRDLFFVFLMIAFAWTGMALPMKAAAFSMRWVLLATGAIVGFAVFMTQPRHRFGVFHLLAAVSVLGSFISASVSDEPAVSALKALSIALLFLYAACGGRTAIIGREDRFVARWLTASEIVVYGTSVCYFLLNFEIWGNPNSLGLVIGLTCPVLLWAAILGQSRSERTRRYICFFLAVALLIYSHSRASILASSVAMVTLCILLRKNRLIIQGLAGVLCLISFCAIVAPSTLTSFASESTDTLVYKGKRDEGFWGSRRSVWQQTVSSVKQRPWFGTGFGTSGTEQASAVAAGYVYSDEASREHGNSYLAIIEWVGLLGCVPFYGLAILLAVRVVKTTRWIFRTGVGGHPATPFCLVILAGLVHAGFEDWLFAAGYYVAVFFWTLSFSFMDIAPVLAKDEHKIGIGWAHSALPVNRPGILAPHS